MARSVRRANMINASNAASSLSASGTPAKALMHPLSLLRHAYGI